LCGDAIIHSPDNELRTLLEPENNPPVLRRPVEFTLRSVPKTLLGLNRSLHHRVDDHVGVEGSMRDDGLSPAGQDELWRRWRAGESLGSMSRSLEIPLQHVRRFLAQTGGV
jgi:hypothetical protein